MQVPYQIVHASAMAALAALRNQGLVSFVAADDDPQPQWRATQLGQAIHDSALPTKVGKQLFYTLSEAPIILGTPLHLVFLIMQVKSHLI